MTTEPLTSAVRDSMVPASCLQAEEAGWAHQLIAVLAAIKDLTAHQKVAAFFVTEIWSPWVLTFHWCWWENKQTHI